MKLYNLRIWLCCTVVCALATAGTAQQPSAPPAAPPAQAGQYTSVSGSISQFNYDRDGEVEGFVLHNKTLVHLPPREALRIESSVHTGDNVQITGFAQTSPAGF